MILNKIKSSLRLKLVLVSVIVEVIMLSLLIANSVRLMNRSIEDHITSHAEEVYPLLNASLASHLFQRDLAYIREFLDELISNPDHGLSYVIVYDDRQNIYTYGRG